MKKTIFFIILFCFILPCLLSATDFLKTDPERYLNKPSFLGYVEDRFIVVLKDDVMVNHSKDMSTPLALSKINGFDDLAVKYDVYQLKPQFPGSDQKSISLTGVASEKATKLSRYYKVYIQKGTLDDAMADYAALPEVESVEPIGIHALYATPNDGNYTDQWHYYDTYGMEADQAWNTETGAQTVLVGDLDIGTMYDHGDLGGSNPPGPNDASTNGNIWVNTNETPGNGTDDDGNGYTDDIIGWDFVDRTNWYSYPCVDIDCGTADNEPSDGDGHGTHTAGTIAAITNNGYGVCGVAGGWGNGTFSGGGNGVKIVPCRIGYQLRYFGQDLGVVIMDYVAEAMYYMGDLKASGWNVASINCSFGTSNSGGLAAACNYLIAQDVVVCVAAGNSSSSSADYLGSRGDCIDVGATDVNGNPASFTNYGSWVDIAAPGVNILSTITDPANPDVDYIASMDGTSMACPHVAGAIAVMESYDPSLSATDKIDIMLNPANMKSYNQSRDLGDGLLDLRACLDAIGPSCDVTANFSASTTSSCVSQAINFTDQSTGTGIDGWSWNFGDGGTSTAQNPGHTYTSAGTYTVTLTASSSSQSCNDQEVKTNYITVNSGPTAGFVGSPTSGTEPLTVNFTNQSTNATLYSWTFGDGGTSTATNPSHEYASAGTYTVSLTATNSCGNDTDTKTNYITVNPCLAPVAAFSGTPLSGEVPLSVSFTDASTNGPTSWSWNFGDGGTSTSQNPNHTYNNAGTYTVTLTATNSCGSDGETKTDYVTVTCTAPSAGFVGSPTSGEVPLNVNFTDQSTGATSWSWDFGDGGTSSAQNPSYEYTSAGTYTVELSLTNSCGSDIATMVDYITVETSADIYAYALSDIAVTGTVTGDYLDTRASDNVYEVITEVQYTGHPRKTYSYLEHKWNFDVSSGSDITFYLEGYRSNNSDGDNFTFEYSTDDVTYLPLVTIASATEQTYSTSIPNTTSGTVFVRVSDTNRSWGNLSFDNITIDEMYFVTTGSGPQPPVADFSGTPTSGVVPLNVNFTDLSSGSPTSWDWDFGDGGSSTSQNPSYTYNSTGTYTVVLTVTNAYGSDTNTKTNYIAVSVAGNDIHVHDMVVTRVKSGPNYSGRCVVTINDNNENPVSGATVYVIATGPTGGSYNGVAGANGTVTFTTSGMKKPSGEWCFEVTGVSHTTMTYNSGSNHVTSACESGWLYGDGGVAINLNQLPGRFNLSQNHPNPFNPTTTIAYSLPESGQITLKVYNLLGHEVKTLVNGWKDAGDYEVTFDAEYLASGIYFYRLNAGEYVETKRMLLLK
jgi:PKD repeat protein